MKKLLLVLGLALAACAPQISQSDRIATSDAIKEARFATEDALPAPTLRPTRDPNIVILRHTVGQEVQMFHQSSYQPLRTFRNGKECEKVQSDQITVVEAGITMRFYLLKCDNVVGLVNVQFAK